jgi:DNA-directed RNA polymerase subunit RPC12/RpoP
MQVQSVARAFLIPCYACKREVKMTTRIWEIDTEKQMVDYWGACPYCGAELFECAGQSAHKELLAEISN